MHMGCGRGHLPMACHVPVPRPPTNWQFGTHWTQHDTTHPGLLMKLPGGLRGPQGQVFNTALRKAQVETPTAKTPAAAWHMCSGIMHLHAQFKFA